MVVQGDIVAALSPQYEFNLHNAMGLRNCLRWDMCIPKMSLIAFRLE